MWVANVEQCEELEQLSHTGLETNPIGAPSLPTNPMQLAQQPPRRHRIEDRGKEGMGEFSVGNPQLNQLQLMV